MLASADGELLLESMREAGWVMRSDEGEWLLTVPAGRLTVADVVARFALNRELPPELGADPLAPALAGIYGPSLDAARVPIGQLAPRQDPQPQVG